MATQTLTPPHVERATDTTLPIVLRLSPVIEMTDAEFLAFCEINHEARIERTAEGELEIMPPAGMYTGSKELDIAAQLRYWARRDGSGIAFGSSAGFTLQERLSIPPSASLCPTERSALPTPPGLPNHALPN